MPQEPSLYVTSDVALAAYLRAKRYPLCRPPQRRQDGKVFFEFDATHDLAADVLAFANEDEASKVEARRYFDELASVRALIHNPWPSDAR